MKKYIYSNRKEIEMKNANQNNINEKNSPNKKEIKLSKLKDAIPPLDENKHDNKQDSFLIKKKSNIKNYAFLEIIHKKTRTNKNIIEEKSKRNNDMIFITKEIISRNNNENENINGNNRNENISINNYINCKKEGKNNKLNNNIKGANLALKINEEKKEKGKEDKKQNKKEKEEKKEDIKEKEEKKDTKKEENEKDEKNNKEKKEEKHFTHIRLITSISKDKNKPKKIDYDDNIPKLYTYKYNINKNNNNKTERKNSSISKKEDNTLAQKMSNHNLYICNTIDQDKKYKKVCKSKETNHEINEHISNTKLNISFRSINFSHSKPKKLKTILNKKSIKSHLFQYFSSESKKIIYSSNLELRDKKEKTIYHNNKIFERIILKKKRKKNNISVQKKNLKVQILNEKEKEKIIENEKENENDEKIYEKNNINTTPNKRINSSISQNKKVTISKSPEKKINKTMSSKKNNLSNSLNKKINTSNSSNKEENNSRNSPNIKNNINKKNSKHSFEINIRIMKDQTKEIKIYENGKYEGIIINGKREKNGVMEYNDGSKYDGEWNNDKQYGKGIFTKSLSSNNINLTLIKYVGDFVNDKKEGKGTALYSNGDKYEGEWKNNKQYGKGIVVYSTGGRYEGEWADGKFNGLGIYYLRNGEKYEGKFKDNRYNGYGKFYHINGDILEGIFINDQPNGECILHKPDGTVERHNF